MGPRLWHQKHLRKLLNKFSFRPFVFNSAEHSLRTSGE
jgi:hypothetical protein